MGNDETIHPLLERAGRGDAAAAAELFTRYRAQLRQFVAFRLDDRLRARFDPSDVLQEANLEVSRRLSDYLADAKLPFHLWLRLQVGKHLINFHRHHLHAQKRDAGREARLAAAPDVSSAVLAEIALDRHSSPSHAAVRSERAARVRASLDEMEPLDREILTLHHYEMLSRGEIAQLLGVSENAVRKRYIRALDRLERALAGQPGGLGAL